ncbi:hypothetical protein ACFWUZ_10290 [Streptomyces sp. NPDC058646]|uniref:hypothetical protein n=1 Tax=Streptomyces sp. NPDC058646 TaxID=3346574 RepID=UPI00365A04F1
MSSADGPEGGGAVPGCVAGRGLRARLPVAEGAGVHRIFESVNGTGVGLSRSDLLRTASSCACPAGGEDVCRKRWLPVQELRGPAELELLVWLDPVVGTTAGRGRARAWPGGGAVREAIRTRPFCTRRAAAAAALPDPAPAGGELRVERAGRLRRGVPEWIVHDVASAGACRPFDEDGVPAAF